MKRLGVLAVLFLALDAPARAQLASLLKDIHHEYVSGSSSPIFLGSVAGDTFFTADEGGGAGRDLWVTNGTPEGTRLLDEACPDSCQGFFTKIGELPDRLFLARSEYSADGPVNRLISVTGNPVTVVPIIAADSTTSLLDLWRPTASAILGSELFFSASADGGRAELLASTGATGGLRVVHTFDGTAALFGFQRVGEEILFWREVGDTLSELWTSDGTEGGIRLVASLDVHFETSLIGSGAQHYLFTARDGHGSELWSSDGTAQGTIRLTDFPALEPFLWNLQSSPTRAFFFVEDVSFGQELWGTDGTRSGTRAVTSFGFHQPFGNDYENTPLTVVADQAYFFATDGLSDEKFWIAHASFGSATVLANACENFNCFFDRWIAAIGSQVFFVRSAISTGVEVWTTAGTVASTHVLLDACPGECNGGGDLLAVSPSRLIYGAFVGHDSPLVAQPPWTSATSLYDSVRNAPIVSDPGGISAIVDGDLIYFGARDANFGGIEPWVSRGQVANTFALADLVSISYPSSEARLFKSAGGTVGFLAADESFRTRAWLTEGTPSSTRSTLDSGSPCLDSNSTLHVLGSRFVSIGCQEQFSTIDPASNLSQVIGSPDCYESIGSRVINGEVVALLECYNTPQFWKSDGTAGGTRLTLAVDSAFYVQGAVSLVNQKFLFSGGSAGTRAYALSANGSSVVPLTAPGVYPDLAVLPDSEALGFFTTNGQLWRTDGTPSGTVALGAAREGQVLEAAVRSITGYDLLIRTNGPAEEIWESNGTAPGTHLRASVNGATLSPELRPAERVGDKLYFILGSYYEEPILWVLEDSSQTALQLHQASISGLFGNSRYLAEIDGHLLFSGCDSAHGCELWISDGTLPGTRLLQDIYPGRGSSFPSELTSAGSTLYFDADDGLHGPEPWNLRFSSGAGCTPSDNSLCLDSNRFQVSATWRDFSGNSGDATAVPISGDTGYFWFFDDANVEVVLKLIDGTGYNGHHWVYYGALSNVEYTFTVTDSETGAAKRYFNPAARFASSGDILAFGPQGAHASGGPAEAMTRAATPPEVSLTPFSAPQGLPGPCIPTATRFCILNNRFAVTATWRDFAGNTGTANAGTLTDDTGYLWFFDEANIEVVLKMVDATDFNAHFWVYYGALSNVEYTLTVTDTVAGGSARVYHNALGQFGSFGDIEAFPAP